MTERKLYTVFLPNFNTSPDQVARALDRIFGDLIPKTHLPDERKGIIIRSRLDATQLSEAAAKRTGNLEQLRGMRATPTPTDWMVGELAEFQLRMIPTARGKDPWNGRATEYDFYRAVNPDKEQRAAAYRTWLEHKLEVQGGATLEQYEMTGFEPGTISGKKSGKTAPMLTVHIAGTMEIAHPERFVELLEHGIGRHRNRGFGLVLLEQEREWKSSKRQRGKKYASRLLP